MRITSSVTVGRIGEIDLLRGALSAAQQHSGHAVFLVGEAGIGKSRLAGECVLDACGAGMPVLRGRASSTGLVVPFRPLAEALSSRFRVSGPPEDRELDPYRPALARIVPEWRASVPTGHTETVVELAEGLLRLLAVLGRDQGCLLLLEDLHDADTETLAVLEYLVDNVADLPVLVVGTLRPESGPTADLVRSADRRQTATVQELGPLSDTAVRTMTDACLGVETEALPETVYGPVTERSGGSPYLVEMLLADLVDSGALYRTGDRWEAAPERAAAVPIGIVRSWAERVDRLDPAVRELLLLATTLGGRFSVGALQAVTGHDDRTFFHHLRTAVDANVIVPDGAAPDRYTFRHELTADALAATVSPAERQALARRATLSLERSGAEPGLEQLQLVASLRLTAGDQAGAARQFAQAGRRMLTVGGLSSALVLLERAHGLADEADRSAITESLLPVLAQAGQLDRAATLVGTLAPVSTSPEAVTRRTELHTDLAWTAVMTERTTEARSHVEAARRLLDRSPNPAQEAALAVVEGHLGLLPGDDVCVPAAAERQARRAAEVAQAHGMPVVACRAWQLLALLSREKGFDEADSCLEQMLAVAEQHTLPVWRIEALMRLGANAFMVTGDATRLELAREAAAELGALMLTGTIDGLLAMNAVLRDQGDTARRILDRSLDSSARLNNVAAHRYLLLVSATLAAHRGRRREMERALVKLRQAGGEESSLVPVAHGLCRAVGALLDEDREGAGRALETAREWERRHPSFFYLSGRYGLDPFLRAVTGTVERAEYEKLRSAPAGALAWNRVFLRFTEAVLLGREGRPGEASALVRSLAAETVIFPVAHHLALRLASEAALEDGWGEPVVWLRTAEEYFHAAGVAPVAAACRAALRRAGASVPQHREGQDRIPERLRRLGVTPREYEVFRLLAERLGNQRLAQRLCISPRTIEKHVAGLMAKSGVTDRSTLCDLAAELAAEEA